MDQITAPKPACFSISRDKLADTATAEDWSKWEAEAATYNAEVRKVNDAIRARAERFYAEAEALYGKGSRVVKYLRRQSLDLVYALDFTWWKRETERIASEKRARQVAEEARQANLVLNAEAIVWLLARGKIFDIDFNGTNAIEKANDLAFEEEVNRREAEGGYIEFGGQDSCDGNGCLGWDMKDRRCSCGNRRVSWTTGIGHSFKEPYIYAEAD